jgi:glycosyltransferase involved in cell wall biosynthesis
LSYTHKGNIYAALLANLLGIRIVCNVSGLGNAFIVGGAAKYALGYLYKFAFWQAHQVFFQNRDDKKLFLDMKLVNPKVVGLLPGSGVDIDYFHPDFNNVSEGNSKTILLVGRMLKEKGVIEFVKAARKFKYDFPQYKFAMLGAIGTTNPTALDKNEIDELCADGVVEYWGDTSDVRSYLAKACCVVLPSYREGLPRSLLEAASMAKPVITTDVPGCREVVDDGVSGFLCEAKSVRDLSAKIRRFLELDNNSQVVMGKKGREKMVVQFDEKIVLQAYLEVLGLK